MNLDLNIELAKPIKDASNYIVYKNGKIFSINKQTYIGYKDPKTNYWKFEIVCDNKKILKGYIHILVYKVFGILPKDFNTKDYVIHHIDGNKDNNDFSNLKLMTRYEHAKMHSSSKRARNERRKYFINKNLKTNFEELSMTDEELYKKYSQDIEKIIKKNKKYFLYNGDIKSIAIETLLKAKKEFNPSLGCSFRTFFLNNAKYNIWNELGKYGSLVKFPDNFFREANNILKAKNFLMQKKQKEPTFAELAIFLNTSEEIIKDRLNKIKMKETVMLSNKIEAEEKINNEDEFKKITKEILKFLKPDEQISVANYFGFELENNKKKLQRKPSHWRIKKIIEKLQKNEKIMHFLNERKEILWG